MMRIHGRWLVDSFYPAATFLGSRRVIGPRDFAAPALVNDAGKSRLGAVWILVPAGFGSLALIVVLAFLLVSWLRERSVRLSPEQRERDAEFWALLRSRNASA